MKEICIQFLLFLFFSFNVNAQDTIHLNNSSFEDYPRHSQTPKGWADCGFDAESPPDIHPVKGGGEFGVTHIAQDGNTYLGLIVRDNETWEAISQYMSTPLKAGKCYEFSLALARSEFYNSLSRLTNQSANYNKPVTIRIWGGRGYCNRKELLGKTEIITNTEWQKNTFAFTPSEDTYYLMIETYYETPSLYPYNGNALVDNASAIVEIECDENNLRNREERLLSSQQEIYNTLHVTREKKVFTNPDNEGTITHLFRGINVTVDSEQSVEELVTDLKKIFEEESINRKTSVLISVLIPSRNERSSCKKIFKAAMGEFKGSYKQYRAQYIISD